MSASSSTNFVTSFDAYVKQAYQKGSVLLNSGAVRKKTGVKGNTHRFFKINKGVATPRIPQTDVVPMNTGQGFVDAALTDWNAADYSDIFDLAALNYDEKQELQMTAIMAIGRRADQMLLDAMALTANATQVGVNIGGTNTGLNVDKILRAKRLMDDAGVPGTDRHMAVSARAIEQGLLEAKIGSRDYNVLMPLSSGELTGFAGFKFHMIEARAEGGLPIASNVRNNFAFHKDAVGIAIGIDMRTEINYVPEKTSTLINSMFKGGAATIDDNGVFDVLTYEDPAT